MLRSGLVLTLAIATGLLATGAARPPAKRDAISRERLNPDTLSSPRGYTHVVTARGGKTIWVSGQVALDAKGELVGRGDVKAQARQVLENLAAALRAAGATYQDVVKLNTYLVNPKPDDLNAFREVRQGVLGDVVLPASTLVGVSALAREGLLIEIEAVAVVE